MEKVIFEIYMVFFKCVLIFIAFILFDIYNLVNGNFTVMVLMSLFVVFLAGSTCKKFAKAGKMKKDKSTKYHFHNN